MIKAIVFVVSLFPTWTSAEEEVTHAAGWAYTHNPFGCDRMKFKLEYNRDWVAKYVKKLFDKELELQHIDGECWLEFEMDNYEEAQLLDEETDPNSLHKPIVKKGQEDLDRDGRTSIVKNPNSSTNINHDVPNITREQQRYKDR